MNTTRMSTCFDKLTPNLKKEKKTRHFEALFRNVHVSQHLKKVLCSFLSTPKTFLRRNIKTWKAQFSWCSPQTKNISLQAEERHDVTRCGIDRCTGKTGTIMDDTSWNSPSCFFGLPANFWEIWSKLRMKSKAGVSIFKLLDKLRDDRASGHRKYQKKAGMF